MPHLYSQYSAFHPPHPHNLAAVSQPCSACAPPPTKLQQHQTATSMEATFHIAFLQNELQRCQRQLQVAQESSLYLVEHLNVVRTSVLDRHAEQLSTLEQKLNRAEGARRDLWLELMFLKDENRKLKLAETGVWDAQRPEETSRPVCSPAESINLERLLPTQAGLGKNSDINLKKDAPVHSTTNSPETWSVSQSRSLTSNNARMAQNGNFKNSHVGPRNGHQHERLVEPAVKVGIVDIDGPGAARNDSQKHQEVHPFDAPLELEVSDAMAHEPREERQRLQDIRSGLRARYGETTPRHLYTDRDREPKTEYAKSLDYGDVSVAVKDSKDMKFSKTSLESNDSVKEPPVLSASTTTPIAPKPSPFQYARQDASSNAKLQMPSSQINLVRWKQLRNQRPQSAIMAHDSFGRKLRSYEDLQVDRSDRNASTVPVETPPSTIATQASGSSDSGTKPPTVKRVRSSSSMSSQTARVNGGDDKRKASVASSSNSSTPRERDEPQSVTTQATASTKVEACGVAELDYGDRLGQ